MTRIKGARRAYGEQAHIVAEVLRDIFIGCVDGIKGFPEAVFPATQVQLCLVHMMRSSLSYVGWKERKLVAADLKAIYRAATEAEAEQALQVGIPVRFLPFSA